jgi:short-subunit dehydrogenase
MTRSEKRSGQTALITGGSGGIGLELAKVFAAHGHDLLLTARHRDALEAAAGTIEGRYGVKVTVIAEDLTDPGAPQRLFDAATAENITIDFLVNNAGFGLGGEFIDTDIERELEMVQVNIAALMQLTKLFLPGMMRRKSGRILNLASTAAFLPGPLMSVYYASKAFVLSFSQALAEELRESGVSVTCLCPGATATKFAETAGVGDSKLFAAIGGTTPEQVAQHGFDALMRGERVAVVGLKNKIMVQAERLAPRKLLTTIARRAQESR